MNVRAPNRLTRSYTQHLDGSSSEVFPLLCPVREREWVNGWDPDLVLSDSGVAELGCVFITSAQPSDAVWVITRYEPETGRIELVKLIPGVVVARIAIQLADAPGGSTAAITYSYTSLGRLGNLVLEEFTEDDFRSFMETWEAELNHFLATGEKLRLEGDR